LPSAPWNSYSGYFIKMDAPVQLNITGFEIQNRTVSLTAGWNLVPVLTNCDYAIEEVMSGLNFEIVKPVAGSEVFWPSMEIYGLNLFETGKAYLIKMNSAGTITFPACD